MNKNHPDAACPDCATQPGRRRFLIAAGAAVAAAAVPAVAIAAPQAARDAKNSDAEGAVRRLYDSLSAEQKTAAALAFDHPKATEISANWHIIPQKIGEFYTADQQQIIQEILRGVTSQEGYDRFMRQMLDDDGGFKNFSCAIFGQPGQGKFEWVMTGRHLTVRADGQNIPDAVFGGPIVYGHGAPGNQKANLFYYQTQMANEVFKALDGKQREKALLPMAPAESSIQLKKAGLAGIAAGELSRDQKDLVRKVMGALLSPYRAADVKEALSSLEANGGLDRVHLSFYKNEDLGSDQEWDIWRLEGPTLVWHFRGAPHVHTWVNFKTRPNP